MSELQIISKGLYKGDVDKAFPIEVKEYIFARENGKKCLLLRFFNSSEINLTAISFWLIQKNSYGEKIRRKKITLEGIYAMSGKVFSPNERFWVDDICADFEVRMVSAFSGEYEYKAHDGEGFVRYPINENKNVVIKRKTFCTQRSKINKKAKYMTLILVFAIILIAFAIIWPFFYEEVLPVIKEAIRIGWDIFKKALASFFRMIGELFTNLFDGKKA